jgi:CubicO group peptidase (beta-lactamase class C family)
MRNHVAIPVALLTSLAVTGACIGQETSDRRDSTAWQVAAPESVGIDPDLLDDLRAAAESGAFQNLHSILVARDGKLIFEEYFNDFDEETLQYTASVSKSVGSILLGIAMDRGLVPGLGAGILDVPLSDLLSEYASIFEEDSRKQLILFRHALSMTGGLEWDETSLPYSDSRNDWIRASQSDDPVGFALSRPVVSEPGAEFNYHGVYSILPSYLIDRETGTSAEAFAAEHLFGPLGIADWEWESVASGLTDTDGGLYLRPRDMAKLGQLYLDDGMWDGRRIVSEAWVTESSFRQVDNDDSPDYCLLWWCGDFHYGDRTAYTVFASGHGGQKIFVFPSHDLVVVVTQQVFDNPYDELNNFAIMSRYVLPSVESEGRVAAPVQLDSEALAGYEGLYAGRRSPIRIEFRDGALVAESQDAPTMRLVPLGEGRFTGTVLELLDVQFAFEPSESARPNALRATWGFRDEEFRRIEP